MKAIFHVGTIFIAIASMGAPVVHAQQGTTTQGPNGATTPLSPGETVTPGKTVTPGSTPNLDKSAPDSAAPGMGMEGSGMPKTMGDGNTNTKGGSTSNIDRSAPDSVATPNSGGGDNTMPQKTSPNTKMPTGTTGASSMSSTGKVCGAVTTSTSSSTVSSTASIPTPEVGKIKRVYSDEIEYNNLVNTPQNIELYVGSSPLCYVSVKPLSDIEANSDIRVTDEAGQQLEATVTKQEDGGAKISFAQAVPAGKTIKIALQEVNYNSSITPSVAQYSLSGGHTDFNEEISYGVARFERFHR